MRLWLAISVLVVVSAVPCGAQDDAATPAELFKAYQKAVREVSSDYQAEKNKYSQVVGSYSHAQANRARCAKRFWGGEFNAPFAELDKARAGLEASNADIRKALTAANSALSRSESQRSLLEVRYQGKVRDYAYWQALLDVKSAGEEGYIGPLRDQIIPATDEYIEAFSTFSETYNTLGRDCAKGVPNHVLLDSFDKARDALLGGATSISETLASALPHVTVTPSGDTSSSSSSSSASAVSESALSLE